MNKSPSRCESTITRGALASRSAIWFSSTAELFRSTLLKGDLPSFARILAGRMLRATPDVVLRGMAGILALFALFGFNSQALAASQTWTGLTDAYWADANWLTAVPGTGDTAIFNGIGNANTTLNLGSGVTIASTIFSTPSAAAYTIGSGSANNQTLTLNDAGSITMNAGVANNELFNAGIILGTDATALTYNFVNNSLTNTLTFAGSRFGSSPPARSSQRNAPRPAPSGRREPATAGQSSVSPIAGKTRAVRNSRSR